MFFPTLLGLCVFSAFTSAMPKNCKCRPEEPCWPSNEDWNSLNKTIAGRLIETVPPGAVCYPTHPDYSPAACDVVQRQWSNSTWHAENPSSIMSPFWAGNSCNPIRADGKSIMGDPGSGARGCSLGKYPVYVVKAMEAHDVQAAVNFARAKNIPFNIKNTGHSFLGRSTNFGSLSVWTHYMKNITFHSNFRAADCPLSSPSPQMAVTIGAGVQDLDLYKELDKYNATAAGGSNPTVGLVGWFTGGGHGPLSSDYGMGADNLLEATMVLTSGKIVTANTCQHPDLFFALRGGGGGTYGIVLSATMKAFPTPQTSMHTFSMSSTGRNATEKFWQINAFIHSEMIKLKEGGMQGYFTIKTRGVDSKKALNLNWNFYLHNKPNGTAEKLFAPIKERLDRETVSVRYFTRTSSAPTFFKQWVKSPIYESVAMGDGWIGGRLLPQSAFKNLTKAARAMETIGPSFDGHPGTIITGQLVPYNGNRELDIGMNPAWRDAVMDYVFWRGYEPGIRKAVVLSLAEDLTVNRSQALKDIAPNSGAYFNEGDSNDPNWKYEFFGKNYDRLLDVKRKYDPEDVLWCRNCVGSDRLTEKAKGELCKAY